MRVAVEGRLAAHFGQRRGSGNNDRTAAVHGFQWRQTEALIKGRIDEAGGIFVKSLEFSVADIADMDHVVRQGQIVAAKDLGISGAGDDECVIRLADQVDRLDDRLEILVRVEAADGKDIAVPGQGVVPQNLFIGLHAVEVFSAQVNSLDFIGGRAAVTLQLILREFRVGDDFASGSPQAEEQELVPSTKSEGVGRGEPEDRGVMDGDDVLAFEQRSSVAETDQQAVPGVPGEFELLPQVAA